MIKPCFGQSARETCRFDLSKEGIDKAQCHVDRLLEKESLFMQPYLEMVETIGEFSAIFFNNKLAHTIQKLPLYGDYRVMDDFGGHDRAAVIDQEGIDLCYATMNAIPFKETLLYARYDLLRDNDGKWVITELEIIEPSLFFRHCPESGQVFAKEVLNALKGQVKQRDGPIVQPNVKNNPFDLFLFLTSLCQYIF